MIVENAGGGGAGAGEQQRGFRVALNADHDDMAYLATVKRESDWRFGERGRASSSKPRGSKKRMKKRPSAICNQRAYKEFEKILHTTTVQKQRAFASTAARRASCSEDRGNKRAIPFGPKANAPICLLGAGLKFTLV